MNNHVSIYGNRGVFTQEAGNGVHALILSPATRTKKNKKLRNEARIFSVMEAEVTTHLAVDGGITQKHLRHLEETFLLETRSGCGPMTSFRIESVLSMSV